MFLVTAKENISTTTFTANSIDLMNLKICKLFKLNHLHSLQSKDTTTLARKKLVIKKNLMMTLQENILQLDSPTFLLWHQTEKQIVNI